MKRLSLAVLLCCMFGSVSSATDRDKWWEDDHCGGLTTTQCRSKYEIHMDWQCSDWGFYCFGGDDEDREDNKKIYIKLYNKYNPDRCNADKCSAEERKFRESTIIEINNCYSRCNAPRRLSDE